MWQKVGLWGHHPREGHWICWHVEQGNCGVATQTEPVDGVGAAARWVWAGGCYGHQAEGAEMSVTVCRGGSAVQSSGVAEQDQSRAPYGPPGRLSSPPRSSSLWTGPCSQICLINVSYQTKDRISSGSAPGVSRLWGWGADVSSLLLRPVPVACPHEWLHPAWCVL